MFLMFIEMMKEFVDTDELNNETRAANKYSVSLVTDSEYHKVWRLFNEA